MKPHRSVAAAAADHIAQLEDRNEQLELVNRGLATKLAESLEREAELAARLERVNEAMQRRIDRIQADRVRQVVPELIGADA